MKTKIIFFKIGSFSHINDLIVKELELNFPNHSIEICDVFELMKNETNDFRNKISLALEYGLDILKKEKYWKDWLFCTSNIFLKARKKIKAKFQEDEIAFTFQTQSLFDASLPNIPHFVYTDSTVLANYSYPNLKPSSFLKSKKWMKLEREIYSNASKIFLFSNNQVASVVKDYKIEPEKTQCVFAGANTKVSEPLPNKVFTNHVLFVGVDWNRKGGPTLWKALQKSTFKFKLTIVGCSPKIIDNRVDVVGRIPIKEVAQYYQQADIFCTPTIQEPFGIVFLEAMHYQLPVISTTIGALPDMVINQETGYLIKPGDHKALQSAIEKLLNNPELAIKMGNAGRTRALKHFNWKQVGNKMASTIKQFVP